MDIKRIGTIFTTTVILASSFSAVSFAENKKADQKTASTYDILVPGKISVKTHTVVKGENFNTIAKKYKLNAKDLMAMNGVKSPYTTIGKKIVISKYTSPGNSYNGIIVNVPEQRLYYFNNDKLSNTYLVSVGKQGKWQTPLGDYKITYKDKAPVWKVPVSIQKEMAAKGQVVKTEVPPGPQNPLGNWWMGLDKNGLGIHSTNAPTSIGYSITHGCVRMTPSSASELFAKVKDNTPVRIIYQPVKVSLDDNKKAYLEVYEDVYKKSLNTEEIAKELLKKANVDLNTIDLKKLQTVAKLKDGNPTLISKA